mmetsp:Transcript_22277/g.63153  ORF Transcript_22277/g.63153 Transcript_22277/m.63153 type:complete len:406 (-) Transcript_22277:234-1451(-)|eukprot:CAMPEP_0119551084 /NCGR_PEP_ID=MMETSP1352-20130426/4453_1 /TAXON_ID=265584 /ORGANISM="Stauroneis constricta, Strain CCMP1120" /LENGTH=405 /DNA_ID=CAMNT_0007597093 /DNA_START=9 /DNA_END=1226 /DNA_ORIENTATION=-
MPSSADSINTDFRDKIEDEIPALFFMFAGADDSQQSADVSNVGTFKLPDPAGKAGGACTAALLQVMHADEADHLLDLSWTETLVQMRDKIEEIGLPQVPQLSSSRPIDVREPLKILPDDFDPEVNTARAMLIGVNYVGEEGELTGCHNDVRNMKHFLLNVLHFERENMLILVDDGKHHQPTKKLIMDGFHKLVEVSEPGDAVFIQFSGHGGQIVDTSGDEDDGFDEILIPGDYKESGQIVDDDIYDEFVTKMGAGVRVTAMIDCCHSGTAMDLPYVCSAGDTQMHRDNGFKIIPQSGMELKENKKKKKENEAKKAKKDKERKKKAKEESKKKKKSSKKKSKEEEQEQEYEDDYGDEEDDEDMPAIQDMAIREEEEDDYDEEEEEPEEKPAKKKKKKLFGFGKKRK